MKVVQYQRMLRQTAYLMKVHVLRIQSAAGNVT